MQMSQLDCKHTNTNAKKTIKIHFSATLKIFSQSAHNVEDVLWLKMWPHKIYVSLIHGIIQINLIKLP